MMTRSGSLAPPSPGVTKHASRTLGDPHRSRDLKRKIQNTFSTTPVRLTRGWNVDACASNLELETREQHCP